MGWPRPACPFSQPHIEHAVARRDERDVLAIRRYARLRLFRVPEQGRARNQRDARDRIGRLGRRLRCSERGNGEGRREYAEVELVHEIRAP